MPPIVVQSGGALEGDAAVVLVDRVELETDSADGVDRDDAVVRRPAVVDVPKQRLLLFGCAKLEGKRSVRTTAPTGKASVAASA